MQTFLTQIPIAENPTVGITLTDVRRAFNKIAKELDNKRLHKQALEAWQILMVLTKLDPQGNHREPKGWVNHPAVVMWRGHERVLAIYIEAMCKEWIDRGFKTTIRTKSLDTLFVAQDKFRVGKEIPLWLNTGLSDGLTQEVISSHRKALLNKNYEHYSQFNWPEDTGVKPDTYEYVWPEERSSLIGSIKGIKSSAEGSSYPGMVSVSV